MRRSVYQKKFYSGSFLYTADTQPDKKSNYQRAYHSFIEPTTDHFLDSKTPSELHSEDGARSLLAQQSDESFVVRPNYARYSCSGITYLDAPTTSKHDCGRPFRSADFDAYSSPEFGPGLPGLPGLQREQSEESEASFKKSQDSDIFIAPYTETCDVMCHNSEPSSSGSYISQRPHAKSQKTWSNPEEIEVGMFSRQSSESSDFIVKRKNWKSDGSMESDEASDKERQLDMKKNWLRVEISQDSDEMMDVASEPSSDVLKPKMRWIKHELSIDSDDTEDFLTKNLSNTCAELMRRKLQTKNSQDSDEMNDIFASKLDLSKREGFRKERSLDSDETSGFVSKHSSETTDFSSKLSSSSGNFTTKHLSEPLGFGSIFSAPNDGLSQRYSEPSDFVPKVTESPISETNEVDTPTDRYSIISEEKSGRYGQYLKVEEKYDKPDASTGAISKHPKRERFRRSKRIKHFNLRRIDDTDNDSSCDSDKYLMDQFKPKTFEESIELAELPSARLKEEVGLPKHLSRESSCDRYGLSRSERTITSFESDRFGPSTLHDFESFCDAVMFSRRRDSDKLQAAGRMSTPRKVAASVDSTAETDEFSTEDEILGRRPENKGKEFKKLRKSKSKRDLTQKLKCMLL